MLIGKNYPITSGYILYISEIARVNYGVPRLYAANSNDSPLPGRKRRTPLTCCHLNKPPKFEYPSLISTRYLSDYRDNFLAKSSHITLTVVRSLDLIFATVGHLPSLMNATTHCGAVNYHEITAYAVKCCRTMGVILCILTSFIGADVFLTFLLCIYIMARGTRCHPEQR